MKLDRSKKNPVEIAKSFSTMAWRNLRRNTKRNFATGVAISAGFTAFLLAAGYANRVESVLSRYTIYGLRAGHLTILKKDALEMYPISPQKWSIDPETQSKISAVLQSNQSVEIFGRILTGQGIIGNGCKTLPFVANGVDLAAEEYAMTHPDLLRWAPHIKKSRVGDPLWENFSSGSQFVAISSGLATLLGKTKVLRDFTEPPKVTLLNCLDEATSNRFSDDPNVQLASGTWDGQLNAVDADIVQTYSTGMTESNNSSVTLDIRLLQNLLQTSNVKSFSVWLKKPKDLDQVLRSVKQSISTFGDYDVLPWHHESIGPYYVGTMRFIYTMVAFIGFVLALVIVLSIFNSATMTVIERSEEIGMLRSLGYSRRLVRLLFAFEGLLLTLISTITGIIASFVSIAIVNALKIQFNPPGVEGGIQLLLVANFGVVLVAALCVSSLGVIATWLAVAQVAQKNIAELVAGSHR